MNKRVTDVKHEMRCDLCGKEETIYETNTVFVSDWFTRHWSRIDWTQFPHYHDGNHKVLDLCPTCTKKFRKLVRAEEV